MFVATGPLVGIPRLLVLHPDPLRTGLVATLAGIPAQPLTILAITASLTRITGGLIVARHSTAPRLRRS